MKYTNLLPFASLFPLSLANKWKDPSDQSCGLTPLTISAKGINATFLGYGARLTSLFVDDKDGIPRDVVVGYDEPIQYIRDTETVHTYFGTIVGRYVNRIKNGSFSVEGTEYEIPKNEHGGLNTLHGGFIGYDQLNWTVTQSNKSSVTYTLLDPAGRQGFPGTVLSQVTYSVSDATSSSRGKFTARIVSLALDHITPIMLSTHIYWNIGSFLSSTILNNTLQLPHATRYVDIDGIQIPIGKPSSVSGTPLNFTSSKQIGAAALVNNCGDGCTGLDNAFILDTPANTSQAILEDQLIWSSPDTGLTMNMRTNQRGVQIYSCVGQNGTAEYSHASQGTDNKPTPVEKYGCLVIEPQQYIDGINHPEWGVEYDFSV